MPNLSEAEELELLMLEEEESQAAQAPREGGVWRPDVPTVGPLEAARRGFSDTAGFGLAPVAAGVGSAAGELVHGESPSVASVKEAFKEGLESEQGELKEAQIQQPVATDVGSLLGVGASAMGASPVARGMGRVAAIGAAEGAIRGAQSGASPVKGAIAGGAVGGLISGGLAALGNAQAIGERLKELGRQFSVKTLKLPDSQLRNTSENELQRLGQMLLDEDITSKPGFLKTIASRASGRINKLGDSLRREYVSLSTDFGNLTREQVTDMVESAMRSGSKTLRESGFEPVAGELTDFMGRFKGHFFRADDVWELAKRLEQEGRVFERATDAASGTKGAMLKEMAGRLRESVAERVARQDLPRATRLRELNALYSGLSEADEALQGLSKVSRYGGRGAIKDITARVIDAVRGGAVGRTTVASGANALGKLLESGGSSLGRFKGVLEGARARGAASLAATHYVLSQTDPEYQEMLQGALTDEEN